MDECRGGGFSFGACDPYGDACVVGEKDGGLTGDFVSIVSQRSGVWCDACCADDDIVLVEVVFS